MRKDFIIGCLFGLLAFMSIVCVGYPFAASHNVKVRLDEGMKCQRAQSSWIKQKTIQKGEIMPMFQNIR